MLQKKLLVLISIVCLITYNKLYAQDSTSAGTQWSFNPELCFYFIPDEFFVLPVFRADKNKLHLEGRYNYEDFQTFSAWVGYNIMGGNKLEYTITPMVGGVVGNSNGIAPGLELTLVYNDFELYSETESFIDLAIKGNDFIYTWTDLTYSPKDWLWVGLSAQRTRLYQTDLDIQRGLIVGGGNDTWELTGYLYNAFFDDPFVLISLAGNF